MPVMRMSASVESAMTVLLIGKGEAVAKDYLIRTRSTLAYADMSDRMI